LLHGWGGTDWDVAESQKKNKNKKRLIPLTNNFEKVEIPPFIPNKILQLSVGLPNNLILQA